MARGRTSVTMDKANDAMGTAERAIARGEIEEDILQACIDAIENLLGELEDVYSVIRGASDDLQNVLP